METDSSEKRIRSRLLDKKISNKRPTSSHFLLRTGELINGVTRMLRRQLYAFLAERAGGGDGDEPRVLGAE